jgi:hypothetical protein
MNDIEYAELADKFETHLWESVKVSKELGYFPTTFEDMLRTHNGVIAAKRLIAADEAQSGLDRLAKLRRLDLSMENIMLKQEFSFLFTESELEVAKWRLAQKS